MKKFIIMFAIAIIGFSLFAEIKSLNFENYESVDTLFYDNSDYKYWSKDEILENCADKPYIYFDKLDYIMGVTWDTDFSEWTERLMEVVAPILKKYKYVVIGVDNGDKCYFIEHFLIGKNKIFGRYWNASLKETK